jgi:hypothetical protein
LRNIALHANAVFPCKFPQNSEKRPREQGKRGGRGRPVAGRAPRAARRSPWYFPSAAASRHQLEAAGFAVDAIDIIPRPTPLPAGIEAWLDAFAEDFFGALPAPDRAAALAEVVELLRPVLVDETGMWIADYVRLRFRATRAR